MAELSTIIRQIRESGDIEAATSVPRLRFMDDRGRLLLGATVMPERKVPNNFYMEEDFALVDMIADDTDRYSPVKFKGTAMEVASFEVKLGDSSIGRILSAAEFDRLIAMLGSDATMEQFTDVIINFAVSLTRGLIFKNEVQRWRAIVDGEVTRVVNEVIETIAYPSAAGQRTALAGAWSSDTYDPFDDFLVAQQYGTDRGYESIARVITSRKNVGILLGNLNMARRSGGVMREGDDLFTLSQDQARLNRYLLANGFPAIETYDARYSDTSGRFRFFPEDAVVYIFDTGRIEEDTQEITGSDDNNVFQPETSGTVGYVGIGKVGGYTTPGRVINVVHPEDHPKRVLGEGLQTHLPVFSEPNGFCVQTGVN